MNWKEHIVSDKEVLLGKPTIKGTRISVELILDLLANGWTEKMIFESYPRLTENDLKAVFGYLKDCIENKFTVIERESIRQRR
jgi:uncharacterized protein (DUF433 family)